MARTKDYKQHFGIPREAVVRNAGDYEHLVSPLQFRVMVEAANSPRATWQQIGERTGTTREAARQAAIQAKKRLTNSKPRSTNYRPLLAKIMPAGWTPNDQHLALIRQELTRIEGEIFEAALSQPNARTFHIARHLGRHPSTVCGRVPAIRRAVRYIFARFENTNKDTLAAALEGS